MVRIQTIKHEIPDVPHVKADLIKDKPQRQRNQEIKDASNSPRPLVKTTVESKGKGKVLATD